jgi:hypothetical protein
MTLKIAHNKETAVALLIAAVSFFTLKNIPVDHMIETC